MFLITYPPPPALVRCLLSRSCTVTTPIPLPPPPPGFIFPPECFPGPALRPPCTFNPGLLLPRLSTDTFFVPPVMPLPVWS